MGLITPIAFAGGSGATAFVETKETAVNRWLSRLLEGSLGARQENVFLKFASDFDSAVRSSVILGSMGGSPSLFKPGIGKVTNHEAAIRVLDAVLSDNNLDDARIWEVVKSELQKDRTSS